MDLEGKDADVQRDLFKRIALESLFLLKNLLNFCRNSL